MMIRRITRGINASSGICRGGLLRSLQGAWHTTSTSPAEREGITVNWKKKDGSVITTVGKEGDVLLRLAQRYEIELEGACEGVCACSTCHIILEDEIYDSIEEPSEDEEDMLDQAFGLTATSRLGCQIKLAKEHEGMTIKLPSATRNFYVDGHVPKPH